MLGDIRGTPTIRLYKPKKKQKPGSNIRKIMSDYQYERKAVDMKKFVEAQMPDFSEKVNEPKDLNKFNDKANSNQLPRVLLFSSKPKTSPLTKYLSTQFRRRLLIAEIKPTKKNAEIIERFGIKDFPTVLVIPPTAEGEQPAESIFYDGDGFTRNKLHSFLSKYALKDPVLQPKKKEEDTEKGQPENKGQESDDPKEKVHTEF